MKLGGYSSYTLSNLTRNWISRDQSSMVQAQYEAVNGRHFDMSDILGSKVGRLLDVQMRAQTLTDYKTSNDLLGSRLETAQIALKALVASDKDSKGILQGYLDAALSSVQDPTSKIASGVAKNAITSYMNLMNSMFNGKYVFSGTNSDIAPMKDYDPGSGKGLSKKFQDLFSDFVKNNVAGGDVKNITTEQLDAFLDGPFAKEFDEENWKQNFSNAKDEIETNRINENGEKVPTGISANNSGFRHAMMAMVMVAEFDNSKMPKTVLTHMEQKSAEIVSGKGISGIITDQSALGIIQTRVTSVNQYIGAQLKILNDVDYQLGSVDTAEAASRVTAIETNLNIAFQLTNRISKLSLANYI